MRRLRGGTTTAALAAALLAVVALSPVGCGPPPSPQPVAVAQPLPPPPPPPPNHSGVYRGPNILHFAVTEPFVRDMPSEEQMGSVSVMDGGGPTYTIEARMFEGGESCRIEVRRDGTRGVVVPGTRCASRLYYDGVPVIAMTQVDEGALEFSGDDVRILLRGPFIADVMIRDRVAEVGGHAVWRFQGRR